MWSYYGGKGHTVNLYPKPKHNLIIEPFAGSAKYSLKYFENDVILIDKYHVIVSIWHYLQQCSQKDILSMPDAKLGMKISEEMFECQEQMWLYGFLLCGGGFMPNKTVTKWGMERFNSNRKKISDSLFKIKHWKIIHGNYTVAKNRTATWFIDPPYQVGGHKYIHNNLNLDYSNLKKWALSRKGQIILCENTNANWIDLHHVKKNIGIRKVTIEGFYTNVETSYSARQKELSF